jgi:hypothetical protein
MLIEALYQVLINDPGLVALLGTPDQRKGKNNKPNTGVFLAAAPSEVKAPYIVYNQLFGAPVKSMAGTNRFRYDTFDFTVWAGSATSAHIVGVALKAALDGIFGEYSNGLSPVAMTYINSSFQNSERDVFDQELHESLYGFSVDYTFSYADMG